MKKKSILTKKTATLKKEHVEDFDELIEQFQEESERAAVILATSKLESLLKILISAYLVPVSSSDDPLFDQNGTALSTFSSRIEMAYRLGIIDAEFAKALNKIRKIRNNFAHEVKNATLNSSPHRENVRELTAILEPSHTFDKVKQEYFSELSGSTANFYTAIAIIIMRLETITIKMTPLKPTKTYSIRLS